VANRLGVRACLLLGPDELERGEVTLKEMDGGRQWSVPLERAVEEAGRLAGEREGEGGGC